MTAVIGGISVFIEDDTARFQQSMVRNASLVEQQSQRMTRALGGTARSVDDLNRRAGNFQPDAFRALAISALSADTSIQRLRSSMLAVAALATGGFAGAFATKVLVDTADSYSNIQNKIASVVTDTRQRAQVEGEIYAISQRTRSSYESTATLFQRLSLSSENLHASQADILKVVETTQKALLLAGATTQEAAGAAVQLTQALGSGRLQGDELRSILENAPVLAQAIAKEFGVAVGELKEMGTQGTLTSDRVFRALLRSADSVDERFKEIKPTVASALVVLDNAFTRYIGSVDQSYGASAALAQGIIALSNHMHILGDTAAVVAPLVAAVFAARTINRAAGGAAAPFRAEFANRDAQLAQAREAAQISAERVVTAGSGLADVRSRARTDVEGFADRELVRNRDRTIKGLEADTARLAEAERHYQEVASRAASVDVASVTRSADTIQRSKEFADLRKAASEANTELRRAEADAATASARADSTPQRIQLQERLNTALKREDEIRSKLVTARYDERRNLREDIGDLSEAPTKGTSVRERLDRQLENTGKLRTSIEGKLAELEQDGATKATAAAERLTAAKAAQIQTERALADAVRARLNAELGDASRGLMSEVADANIARRAAAGNVGVSRELVNAANEEVRQNGIANATRAVGIAQQQTTIAASGYARAQEAVAVAAARTGVATTLLSATMGLIRTGFISLVSFLGGPLGVALTAASVGMSIYAIQQSKAAEAAKAHAEALGKLAERMVAVRAATAAGTAISDTDVIQYRELQKGALRSVADQRNRVVAVGSRLSDTLANPVDATTARFSESSGSDLSVALSTLARVPAASEEARNALEKVRDILVAIALVDPKFQKDANEAIDAYAKFGDSLKTVLDAQKALQAAQAVPKTFASPLTDDLIRAPKFDGRAASAAVAEFVTTVKDSITSLSETRIEFPSLSTSKEQLAELATTIGQARAEAEGLISQQIVPRDLADAVQAFARGASSVEEYAIKLQELKTANPSFTPLIDSLISSNEKALTARATLAGLGIDISKLDGMVANVVVRVGVSGDSSDIAKGIATEAAKAAKVVADLETKTRNMRLRADGKSADATTNEIMANAPAADRETVRRNVVEQEALQKRISALGKSPKKEPKSEEEKFEDRLKRIQEEGRAAFFSDTDRELIEELKKIKGEPTLLKNTVDAINNGGAMPEQAQRLRDALLQRDAGKEYRNIVQQYGNAAQIMPTVTNEQAKLNSLLEAGKITQEQYGLALADTMTKFQNYKWIDQTADSIANFSGDLVEVLGGFKKLDDVVSSFGQTLMKLGVQIALIEPLKNLLRSMFAQAAAGGGGNPFSFLSGLLGGGSGGITDAQTADFNFLNNNSMGEFTWLHAGGIAGDVNPTRRLPLSLLNNAPRFHGGNLAPDEFPAILQRGEPVLSRRQTRNLGNAIGALSEMSGAGGDFTVNVHPPSGTVPEVQKKTTPTGMSAEVMIRSAIASDLESNGPLAQSLQGMYGLNRMSGRQT